MCILGKWLSLRPDIHCAAMPCLLSKPGRPYQKPSRESYPNATRGRPAETTEQNGADTVFDFPGHVGMFIMLERDGDTIWMGSLHGVRNRIELLLNEVRRSAGCRHEFLFLWTYIIYT